MAQAWPLRNCFSTFAFLTFRERESVSEIVDSKVHKETSLVVQWLRLPLPMQVWSLVGQLRSYLPLGQKNKTLKKKKKQKQYWNKFNKDFKNGPQQEKSLKKKIHKDVEPLGPFLPPLGPNGKSYQEWETLSWWNHWAPGFSQAERCVHLWASQWCEDISTLLPHLTSFVPKVSFNEFLPFRTIRVLTDATVLPGAETGGQRKRFVFCSAPS